MPSSSSAFALASSLRARSDDELAALIRLREVRETGINDFFDLAEKLLDRPSVQAMLGQLDRRVLLTLTVVAQLSAGGTVVPVADVTARIRSIDHPEALAFPSTLEMRLQRLADLGLIAYDAIGVMAYESVADLLAAWPAQKLPTLDTLIADMPEELGAPGIVNQDATDSLAAEHAFGTSMAVIEMIAALAHDPARELSRGGLGLPDIKRLAASASIPTEHVIPLLQIGRASGLLALDNGRWTPTSDAATWSLEPLAKRWARLADGWLGLVPNDIRYVLSDRTHSVWGEHFEPFMKWLFPAADAAFRARIEAHILRGELLGVTANNAPSTAGSALVARGAKAAETAMTSLFPPEVGQVYLQHDLSIVSPGPLSPAVDARLRAMTTVESRALASTFRVSAESITRALARGDSEESILEFLKSISLTGLPQPLRYLVAETATRYGMLRVGKVTEGATVGSVSYVRTEDEQLLATVLVDRRLSPLGLKLADDGSATSRFDRDVVFLALLDAKYPAAAENAAHEIEIVDVRPRARDTGGSGPAPVKDPATSIIAKLRLSSTATEVESSTAWLERQLEVAIKSKLSVTVTVTMPDGSLQDFLLEPTGLSSGRLRARDRKADIERTLPISRITVVEEHDK
jgi:hypothetical protein